MSEAVADLYGYAPGREISLPVEGRAARFVVAGVWRDYARQHGSILVDRGTWIALGGDRRINDGSIWLKPPAHTELNVKLRSQSGYPADWRPRFADAYREQNMAWIRSIGDDKPCGAASWDGLAASLVAERGVESLVSGREVEINLPGKPKLFS